MYYKYYGNINAHIHVIDLQTICDDAFARNKTFLDILKKDKIIKIRQIFQLIVKM